MFRIPEDKLTEEVIFACFLDSELIYVSRRDQHVRNLPGNTNTFCTMYLFILFHFFKLPFFIIIIIDCYFDMKCRFPTDKITSYSLPLKKTNYTKRKYGFEVDGTTVTIHQVYPLLSINHYN